MATVMKMHWPEVSTKQYEEARRQVGWENNVPKGAKFHVAWFPTTGCMSWTYGSHKATSNGSLTTG